MRYAVLSYSVLKGAHDVVLTRHFVELLGAPPSRYNLITGLHFYFSIVSFKGGTIQEPFKGFVNMRSRFFLSKHSSAVKIYRVCFGIYFFLYYDLPLFAKNRTTSSTITSTLLSLPRPS